MLPQSFSLLLSLPPEQDPQHSEQKSNQGHLSHLATKSQFQTDFKVFLSSSSALTQGYISIYQSL